MCSDEKVSKECIEHMSNSIYLACTRLLTSVKFEMLNEYKVFWTYIGLLFMVDDCPAYFFHNNGSIFIFNKVEGANKIGVLTDSFINNVGWLLSFIEMQHGIMIRSVMDDVSVPDVRKLLKLGEKGLIRLASLMKEVTWVTC